MNKGELIEAVVKATGLTKKDGEAAVKAVLDSIQGALKKGDKVALIGFGTFEVKKTAARKGINPLTKEQIKIPAGKKESFKAGAALKATVNKKKK